MKIFTTHYAVSEGDDSWFMSASAAAEGAYKIRNRKIEAFEKEIRELRECSNVDIKESGIKYFEEKIKKTVNECSYLIIKEAVIKDFDVQLYPYYMMVNGE